MVQRHRDQAAAALPELGHFEEQQAEQAGEVEVGQHGALGQPRGARGVELPGHPVFGVQARIGRARLARQLGEAHGREAGFGGHRRELLTGHHQHALGIGRNLGDLRGRQPPVDRCRDGSALGDGDQQLVVEVAVLVQHTNVIARFDASPHEAGGELRRRLVELGEAAGPALEPGGGQVRMAEGPPAKRVGEGAHAGRLAPSAVLRTAPPRVAGRSLLALLR